MLGISYEQKQKMATIQDNGRYVESVLQCPPLPQYVHSVTLGTVSAW
jgi:hypothetical protein